MTGQTNDTIHRREATMHRLAFIVATTIAATTILGSSSLAAGVNSYDFNCNDLQALIIRQGFVFINNPHFQDFVVADVSYCPGGRPAARRIQVRSVATRDNPQCLVNYCFPTEGQHR
jgi:hypothetical protein